MINHGALVAGVFLSAFAVSTADAAELPAGFGGINVGDSWLDVQGRRDYESLADLSSPWGRHVQECGYYSVRLPADKGQLLITVHDFVVTDLSYVTPINEGSDLLAVADLVMNTYGQPDSAAMRNAVGTVSIDKDDVNYITLDYSKGARPVQFNISGRALWRYQIKVRYEHYRWHENRTYRCAREKEKLRSQQEKAQEEAAESAPSADESAGPYPAPPAD